MVKLKSNTNINLKKIYKRREICSFVVDEQKNFHYKILLKLNGINHYKESIFDSFCKKYGIIYFLLKKSLFKGKVYLVYFPDFSSLISFFNFITKVLSFNYEKSEIIQFLNYNRNSLYGNYQISFKEEYYLKEVKKVGLDNIKINLVKRITKNYLNNSLVILLTLVLNLVRTLYVFIKLKENLKYGNINTINKKKTEEEKAS